MKSLITIKDNSFQKSAIFEIPIEFDNHVFMRVDKSNYNNHKRFVVLINAKDLLTLWGKDPNNFESQLSRGSKKDWMSDYKFPAAESGFSHGFENPVPLAEVTCRQHQYYKSVNKRFLLVFSKRVGFRVEHFPYVSFANGITRTIWLLSRGATYFPVECDLEEGAELLHKFCAYENEPMISVEDLFENKL